MSSILKILLVLGLSAQTISAQKVIPYDFVDPLIGTARGGNVFAGASLPYGMAKAVADTSSGSNQGGFTTDGSAITGFSHMHDSGTGGSPSLGNFPLFPYSSCAAKSPDGCNYPKPYRKSTFSVSNVAAKPGHFSVTLDNGIAADMTVSQHTSLMRFKFPAGQSPAPLILLDMTDLANSRQDNATVNVDASTGRISGGSRFLPSFGSGNFVLFFCTDFHGGQMKDNGIFVDNRASADVKHLKINRGINSGPLPGGAFVRFQDPGSTPILARTGLSFISSTQACNNAEAEIPDFDFPGTLKAATGAWRKKLSVIKIDSGLGPKKNSFITNFYSGIYRTMINPQDYTGENPLWHSGEPYFDSFYCLWDSFRSQLPFLTIVDPKSVSRMIRSLIDTYRHLGWLPDCRMSLSKGFTQGGSNADVVLADAYVKGLRGGIDWNDGYAAVVKDAEIEPFDWSNEGRGGLDSWKRLRYVPVQDFDYKGFGTHTRSISRTLEYSYNDFVISQIAKGLGKQGDVEKYIQSSRNWRNLFKKNQESNLLNTSTSTGFTGFFQPRYLNRTWGFQDPLKCSNIDTSNSQCSLTNDGAETFESSIWEYSYFVPHDQASLVATFGGPSDFVKRLDYLHDQKITYIGNEPAFLTVFQYHYAGRPALSAERAHFYIPKFFAPTNGGLPGNDDSGAMGSFLAFSMMGLFPNPGQDVYLIIPPFFRQVNVTSPLTGKTAIVKNVNFDPTYKNIYIQRATLNGKPYNKNWIDHSFFTQGKKLVLFLGAKESNWGREAKDLPPSIPSMPVLS